MKPKNKIYPLLRMLAVALTAALLGPGCQKDFKWNEPLAVTQNGLNLTSAAGSTRVTVYSTGRWKAEMAEGAWGEVSEVSGNGIGDFLFTYEANNGVSRRARILVSGEGEEQEIVLTQTGAVTEPTLALAETEFEFVRLPRERVQIGVTTNMTQALECILITATDVTDAENPAEAGWLKEIRLEKHAEENIVLVFGIDRNDGSSDRKAAIRLEIPDADGKILAQAEASVVQTTDNATVVFKDEETTVSVPGDQHNRSALLTANFDVDPAHFSFDIAYDPAGTQWITDVTFSESAVSFIVAENTGDQPRSASLKITYKDTDVECSSTLRLTQEVKQLSIADLRAMIPGAEGEVELTGEKMLSAVVISDAGNYNMETNPNLTDTSIDFSVNEKTAYIESLDGQYGLRIVTKLPADNILKRYSSVQLSINGLKLVKESNPERYTLTGFTKEHVLNQNAGTAADLPKKEKHISELTDADIYTYVTLKECEFMLNGGAYINVHDGYCYKTDLNTQGVLDPRFDCAVRGVIDSRGEKINMVLNTQVRWRRKGDGVPAGSGPISGIIVHTKLPRYGVKGDVGTYQIRPVEEADIAFSREESTRNYSTLVRWAWPGMTTNAGIKQHADGSIVPYLGEGRMFSSVSNKLNTSASVAGVSCTLDYNNLVYAKGISAPAVRYNGIWWNSSRNEGEWVAFNFSTEGVSGSCMKMILSAALGNLSAATIVAPLYWDVSYSLDGSTFTRFDTVPIRTLVYWAGPQWYVPGLYEVDFDLPSACFGQKDVTIRLQAASKVCGSTTGEDNGTTTKTYVYFRFGDVSVKYF